MTRIALLSALALALVGCGAGVPASAPEPELAPVVATAAPIPTLIAGASTPDDEIFYRPPSPAPAVSFVLPQVTTIDLPGGARAALLERHDVAVVSLTVMVLRRERSPASDLLLCGVILDTAAPGKRTLRDELLGLGVRIDDWICNEEVLQLSVDTLPARVTSVVEVIAASLRAGVVAPDRFAVTKRRRMADPDGPYPRRSRWIDPLLFPAGHPYHDNLFSPFEGLRKAAVGDLARARDLLRPDDLRVVAVGDLTAPALREALERASAMWPTRPAPKAAAPVKPRPTPSRKDDVKREVLVVDGPAEAGAEVALVLTIPPLSSPDAAAWAMIQAALYDHWIWSLRDKKPPPWSDLDVLLERRARAERLLVIAHAPPGAVAATLQRMRDELTRFDAAPFGRDAFVRTRARLAAWSERRYSGSDDALERIRYLVRTGVDPAVDEPIHQAFAGLTPQGVAQVLKIQIESEPPQALVRGSIGAEKDAIEALDLGKVKVIPPPRETSR